MEIDSQVNIFIQMFKIQKDLGNIKFRFNRKTTHYLREIGWTTKQMSEHVVDLISTDTYYRGPSPHHNQLNATVMEFGIPILSEEIYTKICIDSTCGAFLSFHLPEREITYPLKEGSDSNG